MWIVLALGIVTLLTAGLFARRPDERRMSLIRGLTTATIFGSLTAATSGFTAVMWKVPAHPEWSTSPDLHLIIMQGLGEAMTPIILGSAFLTLTWIVTAVGMRRLSERLSRLPAAVVAPAS